MSSSTLRVKQKCGSEIDHNLYIENQDDISLYITNLTHSEMGQPNLG